MNYTELYQQKRTTAQAIAARIQSGMVCACPTALGEPQAIMDALAERVLQSDLRGIQHHMHLPVRNWRYLQPEFDGRLNLVSWFSGAACRQAVAEGRADFLPSYYYETPRIWREMRKPDVVYAMVSPMDRHGYFSFGVSTSDARAMVDRADQLFLEVNPHMPRALGNNFVHITEVDALCESDGPLPNLPVSEPNEKDLAIGRLVAERIPNGATIQLGIGGMPNAVGHFLRDKKDLGVHTEMMVDSIIDLIECGAVNNSKKNIDRLLNVASFSVGSRRMYDFIDDNPAMKFMPIDYTNDPRVISQNDNVMSINACLEVDLIGQVCSESIGARNISGAGGQVDFVRGANWSKGGRSFICTYSTLKDDTISKIRPTLAEGAHVTTSKGEVDCIVTEYGVAELKGRTASERAAALIGIAHPKFRDELRFAARNMNLL